MKNMWKVEKFGKVKQLKKPVLIEGLPGIGNVGKVVVDFLIDELKAKKIFEFSSYTFPHSVFVNEHNLVELPNISMYCLERKKGNDILFLAGDVQPIDEHSCYEFCDLILDIFQEFKGEHMITLGGIGLQVIPKKPKVYCTGNDKSHIKSFKKGINLDNNLYGIVGPIVGVSGLMIGLAAKRKIKALALLAETLGHPMYLGVKGSKEILIILKKKLGLKIDLKKMEKEIEELEREVMKKTKELSDVSKQTALQKLGKKFGKEISYIG